MENVITVLFKFTPTPTKIRLNGSITTSGWWWPRKVWRRGGVGLEREMRVNEGYADRLMFLFSINAVCHLHVPIYCKQIV